MSAAISLEHVDFHYGTKAVLKDFNLSINAGQVLALLGTSGCGKSTVIRLILGFETPRRGIIRIGQDIVTAGSDLHLPPEERGLAVVFQDLALWPHMTVRGNLAFGLEARRVQRAEQNRRIAALLERLGLKGKERAYPGELSGGERQRVAIARALALEPRAVLLDEPLANLDVSLKRELLELFRQVFDERGTTVLFVTHDLREAAALGHGVSILEDGHVAQTGTLDELRANPHSQFARELLHDFDACEPRRPSD